MVIRLAFLRVFRANWKRYVLCPCWDFGHTTMAGTMRDRLGILLYLWIFSVLPLAAQSGSPVLQSVAPNLVIAGSPVTTITLSGSGFNQSSQVRLYRGLGAPPYGTTQVLLLQATFIDSGTLQATIPHDWLTSAGTIGVRVFNTDTRTERSSDAASRRPGSCRGRQRWQLGFVIS